MTFFITLFLKIVPLYFNILLGFIANRFLGVHREPIARLMFFLFVPLVIFNGVFQTHLHPSLLMLPFMIFFLCMIVSLILKKIATQIWTDRTKDLVAVAGGSGNTGFFGLPLALLLLDDQGEGSYILASFGGTFFDNTVSYHNLSKEEQPPVKTWKKLLKTPTIYAFSLGLLLNFFEVKPFALYTDFMVHIKGAYTVLGMMIIGFGLADLKHFKLDFKFLRLTFFGKFIIWPVLTQGIIAIDWLFFQFFDETVYQALTLVGIVPLGVNMAILASLFNVEPEKASSAVLLSTLFALFYVPIFVTFFF